MLAYAPSREVRKISPAREGTVQGQHDTTPNISKDALRVGTVERNDPTASPPVIDDSTAAVKTTTTNKKMVPNAVLYYILVMNINSFVWAALNKKSKPKGY